MHVFAYPRRVLASLVTVVTVAALGAAPAGAAAGFGDVEDDTYYTTPIAWMVGEDITTGVETGCFGPHENVSRGQVAAFLHRLDEALGNQPVSGGHPFTDVVARYQQEPVGWLFRTGLTTGTGPSEFEPDAPITRGDFAVMLWRYAGRPTDAPDHRFTDIYRAYQHEAIAWMAHRDITTGTSPTTFSPELAMSRAQAATFIYRYVAPAEVVEPPEDKSCTRPLRAALEAGGLYPAEAACAAPYLVGFDLSYLVAVVADEEDASGDLLVATARILQAGCIPADRVGELTRLVL